MMKNLILALSGLGVLAMLFVSINFYIEKNKSAAPIQQAAGGGKKTVFQPDENRNQVQGQMQDQEKSAPNLAAGAMLPENIPPAMLKAMQEKGLSLEDLQKNPGAEQNMPGMGTMPKGKAFPEKMLKAIEEQNKQQMQEQTDKTGDPVQKAVNHIKSHNDEASIKHLEHSLAALEKNPGDETALTSVTELFLNHNEGKAAERLLQKGIISDPGNAMLPFLYGQVLAQDSQYDKAAEQWERALSLQDSAELHYSLGMVYRYQLNREDLATEHFLKAKTLQQHDPKLAEHLALELGK